MTGRVLLHPTVAAAPVNCCVWRTLALVYCPAAIAVSLLGTSLPALRCPPLPPCHGSLFTVHYRVLLGIAAAALAGNNQQERERGSAERGKLEEKSNGSRIMLGWAGRRLPHTAAAWRRQPSLQCQPQAPHGCAATGRVCRAGRSRRLFWLATEVPGVRRGRQPLTPCLRAPPSHPAPH